MLRKTGNKLEVGDAQEMPLSCFFRFMMPECSKGCAKLVLDTTRFWILQLRSDILALEVMVEIDSVGLWGDSNASQEVILAVQKSTLLQDCKISYA